MRLPDFARSWAVLIGTATYDEGDLPDLPAVARNVLALHERLTDPGLSGFHPAHCGTVLDPDHPGEVLDSVRSTADHADDVLFVYFAGHGLLDRDGELHLGLRRSHAERPWTSVRFAQFAEQILESPARSKIVVLDCCYSGRALDHLHMSPDGLVQRATAQLDIDGLYVLTSSSASQTSWAPEGAEFTAFTGWMLTTIDSGVPNSRELLTMRALYAAVRDEMQRRRMPRPQQHCRNMAGEAALFRNTPPVPGTPPAGGTPPVPVTPPVGSTPLARGIPSPYVAPPAEPIRPQLLSPSPPVAREPPLVSRPRRRRNDDPRNDDPRNPGPRWRRIAGALLCLLVLTGGTRASAAAPPSPPLCAPPDEIRMLVPLDAAGMFGEIADDYEYATRGGGDCQRVTVTVVGASREDAARAFTLSWRLPRDASAADARLLARVGLPPDVWIADLGADMERVRDTLRTDTGTTVRIPGVPEDWSIAVSPLVLATTGQPGAPPVASSVGLWRDRLTDREGMVRPDPDTTTIGRLVDVPLYPWAPPPTFDGRSDVELPLDAAALRAGQGIGAPDVAGLLGATDGTRPIVAEWRVFRYNAERATATRARLIHPLYPGDTRWLDYPMVEPRWPAPQSGRVLRTVHGFTAWLRSRRGAVALAGHGLRPRSTMMLSGNGVLDDWRPWTGFTATVADLERAEAAYRKARKPATILVAIDGSGSMAAMNGDRTRFATALDGIDAALKEMGPRDTFGLTVFSTAIPGDVDEVVAPPIDAGHARKAAARARTHLPGGDTPLYRAIADGVKALREEGGGTDRHRILVVLTDGDDTVGGELPRLTGGDVRLVIVNVGSQGCPDPDLATLTRVYGDCLGLPPESVGEQIKRLWQ
ncbi:caspase family protein [Actinoplanes sp. NPDC051851]|uniref:caspase, EACC1-associated type n=1 Tax=Actinoplanes sp. NPDC051851 TaxID=3154753 RepID=UPI003439597E